MWNWIQTHKKIVGIIAVLVLLALYIVVASPARRSMIGSWIKGSSRTTTGAPYVYGTKDKPKAFIDYPVDNNRCMIYDSVSPTYIPINTKFMVVGYEYIGDDSGLFVLGYLPQPRQNPDARGVSRGVGNPVLPGQSSYAQIRAKGRFVLAEVKDLRYSARKLFKDINQNQVVWFRFRSSVQDKDVGFYSYDYDSFGTSGNTPFGVMTMQIRNTEEIDFYHRTREYYPTAGYDPIFSNINIDPNASQTNNFIRSMGIPSLGLPAPARVMSGAQGPQGSAPGQPGPASPPALPGTGRMLPSGPNQP